MILLDVFAALERERTTEEAAQQTATEMHTTSLWLYTLPYVPTNAGMTVQDTTDSDPTPFELID